MGALVRHDELICGAVRGGVEGPKGPQLLEELMPGVRIDWSKNQEMMQW